MKLLIPGFQQSLDEQMNDIKSDRILLFGAGMFLEASLISLYAKNIFPESIIDNSPNKQGTEVASLKIISPEQAIQEYPDAAVIVTADLKYYPSIEQQLCGLGIKKVLPIGLFLTDIEYNPSNIQNKLGAFNLDLDNYLTAFIDTYYPEFIALPSIDIVITEKCSLRCRDCANLIQYYESPPVPG